MRQVPPVILLAGCSIGQAAPTALPCGTLGDPCEVDAGQYLAFAPDAWDGRAPLPTFVHFHGYSRSAADMARSSFIDKAHPLGALVIFPIGVNETWAHTGSPSSARDELTFIDQVVADALARLPVDRDRIVVSGFSQGGSMAWEVACRRPELATAFAPASGGFWEPLPDDCDVAPGLRLRHEHGTSDTTVPMEGRALGGRYTQGDIRAGLARLRVAAGCAGTVRTIREEGRTCQVWSDCGTDGEVQLCLHDGGHRMTDGWHEATWSWAFGG